MKKEKYMKILQGVRMNKCPIRIYLGEQDFGIFEYDDKSKSYQGEFGNIKLDKLIKCLNGEQELDFVKVECADEMEL